jgi:assimilatory nitrate reductase catalytic subunit
LVEAGMNAPVHPAHPVHPAQPVHPSQPVQPVHPSQPVQPVQPVPPVSAVRTTCPYCGVGCGLLVQPDGRGGAAIAGDPTHPANFGRLCSKGSALGETVGLDGRLLYPMLRRADGALARVPWPEALDAVAAGLRRVIERHGPDAVAFYLSGQLLTEDYYVANKLMKGFIGSANVDTNSRLCMASSVAGHRRAFGADTVPGTYADLDMADLIILVGANAAWCHPVLFQRMVRNKAERGAKIVVIDPRRTVTADDADLFLAIAPGAVPCCSAGSWSTSPKPAPSTTPISTRIPPALRRRSRGRVRSRGMPPQPRARAA